MAHHDETGRATLYGFVAIVIWASLALLTHLSGDIPPFQLVAMSFFIAAMMGVALISWQGRDEGLQHVNIWAVAHGVGGLFGYHFFFFLALRHAPVLEATLINYLWPLLIVLFSVFLPVHHQGGALRWWHLGGAALGLAGAAMILFADSGASSQAVAGRAIWLGYGAAFVAALIWSSYSVASRLFSHIPTQAVTLYCFITMLLAALAHFVFETTVWPTSPGAWLAVLLLGLGPVGGAFYFWDFAMKRGDVRLLGVFAYFVPLLSMLILIMAGISVPGAMIWLAALLIIAGAVLAARDKMFSRNS